MRTNMELLAEYLHPLDARLVLRNPDIAQITHARPLTSGRHAISDDCVYVVSGTSPKDVRTLRRKGNFVIIRSGEALPEGPLDSEANIITVDGGTDPHLLSEMVIECCKGIQRLRARSSDLIRTLVENGELSGIAEYFGKLLGCPLVVLDKNFRPIVQVLWQDMVGRDWKAFSKDYGFPTPEQWADKRLGLKELDPSPVTRIPILSRYRGLEIVRCGIFFGRYLQFDLYAIKENGRFEPGDLTIISYACECLGTFFQRLNKTLGSERGTDSLIRGIIEGTLAGDDVICYEADAAGLAIASSSHLATLAVRGEGGHVEEVHGMLGAVLSCGIGQAVLHDWRIIVILEPQVGVERLEALCDDYPANWAISISYPFSSVLKLKNAYDQCLAAERIGCKMFPKDRVFKYERYAFLHLVSRASDTMDLSVHFDETALRIMEYDREHDGELLQTLSVYLHCGYDRSRAAKKLFVHRNTVSYRLDKVATVFGIDFDDADRLTSLCLSIDLLLMGAYQDSR